MSGPIYSDDGYWMWNGTEWIPATQAQNAVPAQQIDQSVVTNVAAEVGVQPEEVAAVAPHFDLNQDGQIDQSEMMQAAQSIANPVNVAAPMPNNISAPNPGVFVTVPKKGFDWKEQKAVLIGGIVTITVAIGVLLFFLLSGVSPVVGSWIGPNGDSFVFEEKGALYSPPEYGKECAGMEGCLGYATWEVDKEKLIMKYFNDDDVANITQTYLYEINEPEEVMVIKLISAVNQTGYDFVPDMEALVGEMQCIILLSGDIVSNAEQYTSRAEQVPSLGYISFCP